MIDIILGLIGVGILVSLVLLSFTYRIVGPSEAHLVVTPTKRFVVSPDEKVATDNRKTYFAFPHWIPFIGRAVRVMDVTIKEIVVEQETYEKNQARYSVVSSTKYRIDDVQTSAETFISDAELESQLKEVITASVRAITVKYDVVNARAKKQEMSVEINAEMADDLANWGLELTNFQLVDFQDTDESTIISDISKRREVEIQSLTREQNAEKVKQARIKEAESDEKARQREIERDKVIGEQEQIKAQKIAIEEKIAQEKHYSVVQVQTIRQAEITKEKAIVEAKQAKEQEAILREKKKLEGEGDRLREEEQAKGQSAPIREMGFAEAEAKEKLQQALNKFEDKAIIALVAEKIVEKEKVVGVETAQALSKADVKVFAGGSKTDGDGFELGKFISSMSVSNVGSADALLNKIARPNDLGLTALGLDSLRKPPEDESFIDLDEYIGHTDSESPAEKTEGPPNNGQSKTEETLATEQSSSEWNVKRKKKRSG